MTTTTHEKPQTPFPSSLARTAEGLRFVWQMMLPGPDSVERLYTLLGETSSLADEAAYVNLGYWKTGAKTLDEAGDALADELACAAKLGAEDDLLDVGFGYGAQDVYWARTYRPRSITGVNVTRAQVEGARRRVESLGLSDRIDLRFGDATKLPFMDTSFDVVIAMESAFHFRTREAFFHEAFRVLRPGGRLVLADLAVGEDEAPPSLVGRGARRLRNSIVLLAAQRFWRIPAENLDGAGAYTAKLAATGFADIQLASIWRDVYPGFMRFARGRLGRPDVRERMNPFFHAVLTRRVAAAIPAAPDPMDYVLVSAVKPR